MSDRYAQRPDGLNKLYQEACQKESDIWMHLPILAGLAGECEHVTEMGVRHGVSTRALLWAQPRRLICYDILRYPDWEQLQDLRGRTEVTFNQADTRSIEIEQTELLFIDTFHAYEQLRVELERHSPRVSRYIAMHDTVTFGQVGEDRKEPGLWKAVEDFIAQGNWAMMMHRAVNNGLTVLERRTPMPDGDDD